MVCLWKGVIGMIEVVRMMAVAKIHVVMTHEAVETV